MVQRARAIDSSAEIDRLGVADLGLEAVDLLGGDGVRELLEQRRAKRLGVGEPALGLDVLVLTSWLASVRDATSRM